MNRRVLVIVSSYAPAMNADMHRARHLSWHLSKFGWDMEVLSPSGKFQRPDQIEKDSTEFFCDRIPVHFAGGRSQALFRFLRINSVGWRALLPMYREGVRLLRNGRFDIVYISTTNFPLFLLGPLWRMRFGIPFVLDIHDPVFKPGRDHPVWATAAMKHRISNWLTRAIERTITRAAAIISVSKTYIEQFRQRYGTRVPARVSVIPFGASEHDFEIARTNSGIATGTVRYVGAGGPIMERSFRLLCAALSRVQSLENIRFELFGTHLGWKPGEPCYLAEIAREEGVSGLVSESPARVSFRRSLELLLGGSGCLILGVDDVGYMPSKLFSYAASGKPLLAAVRKNGAAFAALKDIGGTVHTIWFDENSQMPPDEAVEVVGRFLDDVRAGSTFDRHIILEDHSAFAMAREHAELFDAVCKAKAA